MVIGCGFTHSANTIKRVIVTPAGASAIDAGKIEGMTVINSARQLQFWQALVPAGTTASITFEATGAGGGVDDLAAAVWSITPAAQARVDIKKRGTNPAVTPMTIDDLNIQDDGVLLAFVYGDRTGFSGSWNGADTLTEDAENTIGSNRYAAYGCLTTENLLTGDLSLTSTGTGGRLGMIAASWR